MVGAIFAVKYRGALLYSTAIDVPIVRGYGAQLALVIKCLERAVWLWKSWLKLIEDDLAPPPGRLKAKLI